MQKEFKEHVNAIIDCGWIKQEVCLDMDSKRAWLTSSDEVYARITREKKGRKPVINIWRHYAGDGKKPLLIWARQEPLEYTGELLTRRKLTWREKFYVQLLYLALEIDEYTPLTGFKYRG